MGWDEVEWGGTGVCNRMCCVHGVCVYACKYVCDLRADDIHLTQSEGIEAECCFGVKGKRDRGTVLKKRRHEEGGELGETFRHVMGGTLGQYFRDNFWYGKEMISISMGRERRVMGKIV
ncbi:unnamed protein product [Ilex paraguariensis]|uniref:Uncharacterized protein n=1 Tax=Ilex paraguariensis TaxID=185542 RepID=A0ABC8TL25_9AQUA